MERQESFLFFQSIRYLQSSPLDLLEIDSLVLKPNNTWRYLGFIFDRKLLFYQHINFYMNKAILTIKLALFPNRNNFCTEAVSFLLPYIAFNYGFTRNYYYHTHLGFLTICNRELLSGFLVYSRPLYCLDSKPLQASYPSTFIFTNLVVELN